MPTKIRILSVASLGKPTASPATRRAKSVQVAINGMGLAVSTEIAPETTKLKTSRISNNGGVNVEMCSPLIT